MGKFWSLLFLLVPILGTGLFVVAAADLAPLQGHWLPEDVSTHGHAIDSLWDFILYLTGVIFIITGLVLFWFPMPTLCMSKNVGSRILATLYI